MPVHGVLIAVLLLKKLPLQFFWLTYKDKKQKQSKTIIINL